MRRATWWRATATVGALALTLAACGDGDDDDTAAEEPEETPAEEETPMEEEETPAEDELDIDRPGRDDKLDFGYILPESGPADHQGTRAIQ